MGIVNRTKDLSEQKEALVAQINNSGTGIDYPVAIVERPVTIMDAKCAALGMSGAPTSTLKIQRFVVGAGNTTIAISGALTHVAYGTSGYQTYSLPAAGSSLLNLQKGDLLVATTGGANAGLVSKLVDVVVQNIQDVKSWY
jgi:hypothetical protein